MSRKRFTPEQIIAKLREAEMAVEREEKDTEAYKQAKAKLEIAQQQYAVDMRSLQVTDATMKAFDNMFATTLGMSAELSMFGVTEKEVNKVQEPVNSKADVQEEDKNQKEDQPKYSNWVRNYATISVKEPRKELGEFDWKTANVLLIYYSKDLGIKVQFKEELEKLGARVGNNTFEEVIYGNISGDYTHIISILPQKENPNASGEERLRKGKQGANATLQH